MVDREPKEYRPRRAFIEPEPTENDVSSDDSGAAEQVDNTKLASRNGSAHHDLGEDSDAGRPGDQDYAQLPPWRSIFADLDDDEQPPPLYRDESPTTAPPVGSADHTLSPTMFRDDWTGGQQPYEDEVAPPLYRTGESSQPPDPGTEPPPPLYRDEIVGGAEANHATWVRPAMSSAARRPQARDEESTTLLPRTPTGSRNTRGWQDSIDDFADFDDERPRLGRRAKLALLVSLVAAVVVGGLAIGYVVLGLGKTPETSPRQGPATTASQPPSSSSQPSKTQSAMLLTDDSLINAKDAKLVDSGRTWKVALTQRGTTKNSATPACLGGDPVEGQPTAQQTILRLLSTSGKKGPGILHQAAAFTSSNEAAQAYAVAAKTLGGCVELGGYIESGWNVSGVGDQSLGIIVGIVKGSATERHSIVLSQTGRVLNVADVAQSGDPVRITRAAKALAAAVNAQCREAGGACAPSVKVKRSAPPVGGDEPGLLATGDLPPVKSVSSLWVGNDPDVPSADFQGAQCEKVNWAKTEAKERTARTYLLQDGSDPGFGLDEIVLKLKDAKAATTFVKNLRTTVANCPKIKLTATVPQPKTVAGVGASSTQISGWTATVSQKATGRTNKYRIGAVAVGSKVVYSFLSPKGKYDLTDSQWDVVAVRAGERASQVK
jgi:hypothetical protein